MIVKVDSKKLHKAIKLIFKSYGIKNNNLKKVSKYLIEADLCGQNSHGVARLPYYLKKVEDKGININAKSKIYNETLTTAQVDGGWNFGQLAADDAIKLCIKKAVKSLR